MRILYLCVSAEMGGAERSLFDMMSSIRLAEPAWALHLVTAADGPLVNLAASIGVSTCVLPLPRSLDRLGEAGVTGRGGAVRLGARLLGAALGSSAYAREVRREAARFKPNVIHTNSLKMHLLAAGAKAGPPVVWHMHDYLGNRPMTARLLRLKRKGCAVVIANSESVAADVRNVLGTSLRVVTVLNAVDLVRFSSTGELADLDALAGMTPAPANTVRVGLVGAFGRWKGHKTFLDAIARLPGDLPVRAYIVGGGLYHTAGSQQTLADLRRYAARAGIADRVGFTGFVAKPEEAIRALDIVVHASTAPEPFGLVIAEAMACERAVVASDAGGAREIFTDGVNALSHAPGNATELASRIEQLARDAALRTRLGRAGRQAAECRFDRARLAGDLKPVYQEAAGF